MNSWALFAEKLDGPSWGRLGMLGLLEFEVELDASWGEGIEQDAAS